MHGEHTSNFEGKDVAWTGNPSADVACPKRIDDNSYENVWKLGGKHTMTSKVVVSKDNKTLTVTQPRAARTVRRPAPSRCTTGSRRAVDRLPALPGHSVARDCRGPTLTSRTTLFRFAELAGAPIECSGAIHRSGRPPQDGGDDPQLVPFPRETRHRLTRPGIPLADMPQCRPCREGTPAPKAARGPDLPELDVPEAVGERLGLVHRTVTDTRPSVILWQDEPGGLLAVWLMHGVT
jgi:hypothetical protein